MPGFVRDSVVRDITVAGSKVTSLTATVNSDPMEVGTFVEGMAFLNVTANSGTTPTLDCKVQYSPDYSPTNGTGTWVDSGDSFTQVTTVNGLFLKKLTANFGKYIRFVFTLGGTTPNYTVKPYVALKA